MLTDTNLLVEIAISISLGIGLAALSLRSSSEAPEYSAIPIPVKPNRKP
ncbi:hypothetical protein NC998_08550 [Trichocoleus desertorum GB2-A4]|uniref:Uncharacterized protein n=1 Tax=Trichocoleus desertorum GB2-A4 TaxID=2933944 RepID=A0ABV0J7X8_9CYAN